MTKCNKVICRLESHEHLAIMRELLLRGAYPSGGEFPNGRQHVLPTR